MYVEISGRQTGKTTRLADHASDELINNIHDSDYRIGIVGHNTNSSEYIRDLIIERFLTKINEMSHYGYRDIVNRLEHENPNWGIVSSLRKKIMLRRDMSQPLGYDPINKFYVDEFAFRCNGDNPLTILENAYYCTSPCSDEFTGRLINHCRNRHIDVESYDMSERFRNTHHYVDDVGEFDGHCLEYQIHPRLHPFEESNLLNVKGLFRFNTIKRHKF